jgi:primosomal protein N' (replication factor Y)
MNYYEVLVAHATYHGNDALTYSSETALSVGSLVRVSLRERSVLGIVLRKVDKPSFAAKPIAAVAPYPPLPPQNLQLLAWLRAYYPAPLGVAVRQFVPPTEIFPTKEMSTKVSAVSSSQLPQLSTDQLAALEAIGPSGTHLLHGITGSGKSRVYVELALRAFANQKSAVILTPEIGLTAQLTRTFKDVFGTAVFVLHSGLTAAERRTIWFQILARTTPAVVIGPRSALFSPLSTIGVIIVDESHDNAYKNESAPHYQAGRVAGKLAMLHNAALVLGSATPSVEDYYLAETKNRPIIAMRSLAKKSTDTATVIEMVDMRRSEFFSRNRLLSNALLTQITQAIQRGEQALVYLNRRGTANVVLCSSCGWQSLCPNCDLTLTYHGDEHELRCHVCGFHSRLPTSCPACSNTEILFKSVGTKAVVSALEKLFPTARIQRFDTDTKKTERLEQHLSSITEGNVDIIVGTQMIGKGLDLPKLSVVGVVNADSSLLIPDYTAAEQTYQLISQVVGRVGRGHRAGHVVVQSYDPESATLHAALHGNWEAFYTAELAERKAYHFPPYTYLLKLRVLRASSMSAEKAAETLNQKLAKGYPDTTIEGPSPSFRPREHSKYSWQLLVKAPRRQLLVDIINTLPSGWTYDIDPSNLL